MDDTISRVLQSPKGSLVVSSRARTTSFVVIHPKLGDTLIPRNFTNPVQVAFGQVYDWETLINHGWVELVGQPVECRATHCDPMHCRSETADKSQFEPRPIPTPADTVDAKGRPIRRETPPVARETPSDKSWLEVED